MRYLAHICIEVSNSKGGQFTAMVIVEQAKEILPKQTESTFIKVNNTLNVYTHLRRRCRTAVFNS